jgi:hypothetical protein
MKEIATAFLKAQSEMSNKSYYVYLHKTVKNGIVFYVGKGSGYRMFATGNRSNGWKRIAKKYGFIPEIIEDNLTEDEAYKKEIEYIKYFKDIGLCDANVSLGGKGVNVPKRWWGENISKSLIGLKREYGIFNKSYKNFIDKDTLFDLYVNKNMSSVEISKRYGVSIVTVLARCRDYGIEVYHGKKIQCTTDGNMFNSISEAAEYYGVYRENIRKVLAGKYKKTGNKHFKYI